MFVIVQLDIQLSEIKCPLFSVNASPGKISLLTSRAVCSVCLKLFPQSKIVCYSASRLDAGFWDGGVTGFGNNKLAQSGSRSLCVEIRETLDIARGQKRLGGC